MPASTNLRLENLLLVFNKAMLPFLLQSPFPKNMCIGTFVQSWSEASTKFSKGPKIQESSKYWDAAENKPHVIPAPMERPFLRMDVEEAGRETRHEAVIHSVQTAEQRREHWDRQNYASKNVPKFSKSPSSQKKTQHNVIPTLALPRPRGPSWGKLGGGFT